MNAEERKALEARGEFPLLDRRLLEQQLDRRVPLGNAPRARRLLGIPA